MEIYSTVGLSVYMWKFFLLFFLSFFSVFCHAAGPWQPTSPSLPVLGPSLQVFMPFHQIVNHTYMYTLSSWPPFLSYIFPSIIFFMNLIPSHMKFFFFIAIVSTCSVFIPQSTHVSASVYLSCSTFHPHISTASIVLAMLC